MSTTELNQAAVWEALSGILDPEFGISIVDLGLIYRVECTAERVHVTMTLTTPGCPSGGWIHEGVRAALGEIAGDRPAGVDLVFDPAWNSGMLSAHARRMLGCDE